MQSELTTYLNRGYQFKRDYPHGWKLYTQAGNNHNHIIVCLGDNESIDSIIPYVGSPSSVETSFGYLFTIGTNKNQAFSLPNATAMSLNPSYSTSSDTIKIKGNMLRFSWIAMVILMEITILVYLQDILAKNVIEWTPVSFSLCIFAGLLYNIKDVYSGRIK